MSATPRLEEAETFGGSCLCGSVRYTVHGKAVAVAACHCRDCQKQTGSAFSTIAGFPEQALEISGSPSVVVTQGKRGIVKRFFCPDCGSPIYSRVEATPNLLWLKTGTLDDPPPAPQIHLWWSTAQPWLAEQPDGRPHFDHNPPA